MSLRIGSGSWLFAFVFVFFSFNFNLIFFTLQMCSVGVWLSVHMWCVLYGMWEGIQGLCSKCMCDVCTCACVGMYARVHVCDVCMCVMCALCGCV